MKTTRIGMIALAVAMMTIALVAGLNATGSRAADERTTTVFALDPFDEIRFRGAGNVEIQIGQDSRVEITSPESVSHLFSVEVEDGELEGGFGASVAFDLILAGQVDYLIVTPSLTDLDLTGPMTATLDGLTGSDFDLELSGAATARLTNIDVVDLDVDLDLASTATITGSVETQEIEVSNASTYEGALLESAHTVATVEGASTATVRAAESISGSVRTASTLNYLSESADVQVETSSAGSVVQLPFVPLERGNATPVAASPEAIAAPQTWEVTIAQFKFDPATLEIHVGDTVTWTNQDNFPHDVTQLPKGTGFTSQQFGKGGTFSFTFDTPGTYDYFCALHPIMLGTVVVVE